MTTSFPPHKSLPSTPISSNLALKHLTAYLTATSNSPHLLPNATLQPTGPVAQSDASSNLTIQHLRRVEAGLRGEWLAPVLDLAETSDPYSAEIENLTRHKKFDDAMDVDASMGTDGWQDLSEYQREQSVEIGEIGPRDTAIIDEDEAPLHVEPTGGPVESKKDKETRKKEKKEREKKDKREKAEKARLAASA